MEHRGLLSRDSLTVSAPPEYSLDAAHFNLVESSCSSGGTLRPLSKFVTKLGTAVPLAHVARIFTTPD